MFHRNKFLNFRTKTFVQEFPDRNLKFQQTLFTFVPQACIREDILVGGFTCLKTDLPEMCVCFKAKTVVGRGGRESVSSAIILLF